MIWAKKLQGGAKLLPPSDQNPVYAPASACFFKFVFRNLIYVTHRHQIIKKLQH